MNIIDHPDIIIDMKYVEIVSNFYIYHDDFYCYNKKLTSLYGCPKIVKGSFSCYFNKLKSLRHCPTEVYGNFECCTHTLTSLKYCPKIIHGDFFLIHNIIDINVNKVIFTPEYIKSLCDVKGKILFT